MRLAFHFWQQTSFLVAEIKHSGGRAFVYKIHHRVYICIISYIQDVGEAVCALWHPGHLSAEKAQSPISLAYGLLRRRLHVSWVKCPAWHCSLLGAGGMWVALACSLLLLARTRSSGSRALYYLHSVHLHTVTHVAGSRQLSLRMNGLWTLCRCESLYVWLLQKSLRCLDKVLPYFLISYEADSHHSMLSLLNMSTVHRAKTANMSDCQLFLPI